MSLKASQWLVYVFGDDIKMSSPPFSHFTYFPLYIYLFFYQISMDISIKTLAQKYLSLTFNACLGVLSQAVKLACQNMELDKHGQHTLRLVLLRLFNPFS